MAADAAVKPAWRWVAAAGIAILAGAVCAEAYALAAVSLHERVAQAYAASTGQQFLGLQPVTAQNPSGRRLRLAMAVPAPEGRAAQPVYVVSELTLGGLMQVPVALLGVLLAWRATSSRQRLAATALAAPALVVLEVLCNSPALLGSVASVAASLDAGRPVVALAERWSILMEVGGRVAFAMATALAVIALACRLAPAQARSDGQASA